MKQDEEQTKTVEANPYNRKKYWHTEDVMPKSIPDADSGPAQPDPEKKTGFATQVALQQIVRTQMFIHF